jgi:ECF sigma factor.
LNDLPAATPPDELLALDSALDRLAERDPAKAEVVKLRFFAGLTIPETAAALRISVATAERRWAFARTWLFDELNGAEENPPPE